MLVAMSCHDECLRKPEADGRGQLQCSAQLADHAAPRTDAVTNQRRVDCRQ